MPSVWRTALWVTALWVTAFRGAVRRILAHAGLVPVMARHAPNSLRRSAAALPKMRMPNTTMIAVDNCVPTPNWSPT